MPLSALGGHNFQAWNLHEKAFERCRYVVGHCVGACARIVHLDLDDRIIHGRKIVYRESQITEHTEKDYGHSQYSSHHRAANRSRLGLGAATAAKQTQKVEFALAVHFVERLVVGKILDADHNALAEAAEFVRQGGESSLRQEIEVGDRRRRDLVPVACWGVHGAPFPRLKAIAPSQPDIKRPRAAMRALGFLETDDDRMIERLAQPVRHASAQNTRPGSEYPAAPASACPRSPLPVTTRTSRTPSRSAPPSGIPATRRKPPAGACRGGRSRLRGRRGRAPAFGAAAARAARAEEQGSVPRD